MLEVITDVVHRLAQEEWWSSVRGALDELDYAEAASYHAESRRLDAAAPDGLDDQRGTVCAEATCGSSTSATARTQNRPS